MLYAGLVRISSWKRWCWCLLFFRRGICYLLLQAKTDWSELKIFYCILKSHKLWLTNYIPSLHSCMLWLTIIYWKVHSTFASQRRQKVQESGGGLLIWPHVWIGLICKKLGGRHGPLPPNPAPPPPPPSDTPVSVGADDVLSYPITIAFLFSTVPLHTQCTFITNDLSLMWFGTKNVSNSYSLVDEFIIQAKLCLLYFESITLPTTSQFQLGIFWHR